VLAVGFFQHYIARARVIVPARIGFHIHRAQFPLPERIVDASGKPLLLLLHAGFQPDLDQRDAAIDDVSLDLRAQFQKAIALLLVDESHDALDTCAIVPAPVEDDDLAGCWKPLDVALNVHLRLFAVGRRGERYDSKYARAHPVGQRFDCAALAGGVAPLKDDDDL
jgi:hypothetical protein